MMPSHQVRRRPHPVLNAIGFAGLGVVQVLDPQTTATIAATIQQVEGYYPGSIAYRNNNPGNLVYVGQAGATRGDGGFAYFPNYAAGLQALNDQIQLYAARGMTIQQMMNVYAPASDGNNPSSYAGTIAAALGVDPSTSLLELAGFPGSAPAPVLDFPDFPDFGVDTSTLVWIGAGLLVGMVVLNSFDS